MLRRVAVLSLVAAVSFACSSSTPSTTSPTSTAGSGGANPASLTVVGTPPTVGSSAQFNAFAGADNSSAMVTSLAAWRTSDATVATVTATGLVTGVRVGSVDITAAYAGASGSLKIVVSPAVTYTIKGTVNDAATGQSVANAAVTTSDGAASTITDASGQFTLAGVLPGPVTLTVTKSGYVTSTTSLSVVGNMTVAVRLAAATPCTTIGFDELREHLAPFVTTTSCGMTVRATTSNWVVWTTYGRPAPSIIFNSPAGMTTDAEVVVLGGGTIFRFQSIDLYSSTTPIPYVITGIMNSIQVFKLQNTQGNTFGDFVTVTNPTSGVQVDSLVIHLSNPSAACCSNSMGIDNIKLSF